MRVSGIIELIKTDGRKDKFVKKQLPHDYFLALKITNIDGHPITTLASTFAALKNDFPLIEIGGKDVRDLFEAYKLAPGMTDVCHLSLAYFGDFRAGRNTDNDLDQEKVDAAFEELHGKEISFDIEGCPFQVVSTSKESRHINTEADLVSVPGVGFGRDTILNLLPTKATQERFSKMVCSVFGEGFQLWNAQKKPVPFHVTIAQTDQLNAKIALIKDPSEQEVTAALSPA